MGQMASANNEDKQSSAKRVAVVGAGVSGLAAAYKLKLHGLNCTVFEAEGRAGGKLRSISQDGLIWDEGANTMTESETEVRFLLDNLGLRDKQQFPIAQNKRYIVRNGAPALIPSNPIALIRSNFLSAQSKLLIILEPFLWKKSNMEKVSDSDESVGDFFQRHFGKEVVDYMIDPFVAGTSAGDPESLSMRHTFPELWNLEKKFGSIISGAIQSKFSTKKGESGKLNSSATSKKHLRGSFSFLGGMQTLTDALCKELGRDELKLQSKVLELCYSCNPSENWSVSSTPRHNKQSEKQSFDAVIMTAPLCNVKEMKFTMKGSPFLLNFLPEVSYLPLSVIVTTFKKESVRRPLQGFGVLVPSKEQQHGFKTLGTLFSSMMFPDRAPSDLHLYTTFVGGSRNKELAKASTDELKQIVTSDLRQLLGAEEEPTFVNHFYWSKAFPLYGHNYEAVLGAIEKMEANLPGFFYAGNHRGGLSVGKAISSGCKAADLVISYLEYSSRDKMPNERPC
ncbi:protoporphyrinogen oxidase, mitochondrial isoform X2 [Rhododendron vialii]|uniref:protoporphyrinogen oxidase, mitochondrial isoform X2 n=1 Tax=Rhododendron vialii TaxID=182163 RepID=UPI00265EFD70|nr:protoporphyrinogen oxidase, mitochondrial isoform X2 [Rhododendron vialii]